MTCPSRRLFLAVLAALVLARGVVATEGSVAYWRSQLSSEDPAARLAAATGLGQAGAEAAVAVPDLIGVLDDPDPVVRRAGIEALTGLGTAAAEAATPMARRLAIEPDPVLRSMLGRGIVRFGHAGLRAMPALLEVLEAPQAPARRAACDVMGNLREAAYPHAEQLVGVMLRDPDARVRQAARAALKKLHVRLDAHVDEMLAGLADDSPEVRATAARWLQEVRPRPVQAVEPLTDALLRDVSPEVRDEAARTLRDMGTEAASAVPALQAALRDGLAHQRESAAVVLGSISEGDGASLDALVNASIHDEALAVRLASRAALVRLARTTPRVFATCVQVAGSHGPARRRAAMIDVLGRLQEDAAPAIPALLTALREGPEEVRAEAARSLGRIGEPATHVALTLRRVAADDRSPRVRDAAEGAVKALRAVLRRRAGEEAPPAAGQAEEGEAADENPASGVPGRRW